MQFVGVEFFATRALAYDAVAAYVAEVAPEQLPQLQEHLRVIRPTTDIGEHLGWYLGVEDKQPYIRHAQQLYELVEGLPHTEGDAPMSWCFSTAARSWPSTSTSA